MDNKIVLVKFPFNDLSDFKIRPALKIFNLKGLNNIYLQITSKSFNIKDYEVELDNPLLKSKSFIRIDKIITLDKKLEIKEIYNLEEKYMKIVKKKIKNLLEV